MFVESVALYSIVSILLLVTFTLGNPINRIWLGIAPAIQMISNYLIIFRVANNQQWTTATAGNVSIFPSPIALGWGTQKTLDQPRHTSYVPSLPTNLGESGKDCWKFRGGGGFATAICDMEDSMADDPNIGSFYDMAANYGAYGSIVRPQEPCPEHDPDHEDYEPNYHAMVAEKWNPIFERADQHDVECMFFHAKQGCLAPEGSCPFKYTPKKNLPCSDGGFQGMQPSDIGADGIYMGWDWDSD
ncbi:hypothetical protein C8R44DRAFT_887521 [Mycena epipterygia]|nr:hypothetical protein C8R44DRAFT_887521 [Mycena epipterygia]